MKKKILAMLMIAAMVLGLAACGSKSETSVSEAEETEEENSSSEKEGGSALPFEGVTLQLGLAPLVSADTDRAFWDEQLKKFTEQTGASVEVTVNDWTELQTKYTTGFMQDSAYDVFYAWPGLLIPFIEGDYVEDLTPYYTEQEIADEYFWSNCTYFDGKTYGVAFMGGASYRCLVYNTDILDECGVDELPVTWEEFEAVCEKIHTARPDIYTFLLPLAGNSNSIDCGILQFLYQAGGTIFNEDCTQMTLNTPEMKKAFEFEKNLMDKEYLSEDALGLSIENVRSLFAEGKVAIASMFSPEVGMEGSTVNWQASNALADVKAASFNSIDTLSMSSACKHKDAAIALIKFMNSTDVKDAANKNVYLSANMRASDPEIDVDPRMEDVFAHPERAFSLPMVEMPGDFIDCWTNVQQQILSGQLSIDEGLSQFQAQMDASMES